MDVLGLLAATLAVCGKALPALFYYTHMAANAVVGLDYTVGFVVVVIGLLATLPVGMLPPALRRCLFLLAGFVASCGIGHLLHLAQLWRPSPGMFVVMTCSLVFTAGVSTAFLVSVWQAWRSGWRLHIVKAAADFQLDRGPR